MNLLHCSSWGPQIFQDIIWIFIDWNKKNRLLFWTFWCRECCIITYYNNLILEKKTKKLAKNLVIRDQRYQITSKILTVTDVWFFLYIWRGFQVAAHCSGQERAVAWLLKSPSKITTAFKQIRPTENKVRCKNIPKTKSNILQRETWHPFLASQCLQCMFYFLWNNILGKNANSGWKQTCLLEMMQSQIHFEGNIIGAWIMFNDNNFSKKKKKKMFLYNTSTW